MKRIPSFFDHEKLWNRLESLLSIMEDVYESDLLYIYRLNPGTGQRLKPYLTQFPLWEAERPSYRLCDWIREYYGPGAYNILIRREGTMLLSGRIDIEAFLSSPTEAA